MPRAVLLVGTSIALGIAGLVIVFPTGSVTWEAIEAARSYALAQRAGEAELGAPLSPGQPVSTGTRDRWTCVVFAAGKPSEARVGVLLTLRTSGWKGWFVRASSGTGLDCEAMLMEARFLNSNLVPYIE